METTIFSLFSALILIFSPYQSNQRSELNPFPNSKKEIYYGKPFLGTIEEMIAQLGIEVYPEDKISSFPPPEFGIGSVITIERAMVIFVLDGNEKKILRTWKEKVREFLEEKGISLGEKDKISPSLETTLSNNLEIKITRVTETEIKKKEPIAFREIVKEDFTLEKGLTKIEQKGENGIREKIFLVRRENGKEVSRKLIKSKITKEPKNKIILKGMKIILLGEGIATWYDWVWGLVAASNTLKRGTMVKVINKNTGREVIVKIVDHGIRSRAIIDLSKEAFSQIGNLREGVIPVRLEKVD